MAIVLRMKEFIGCANTSDSFGVYMDTQHSSEEK